MIDALPLLLGPEGYQINRSLRFRSSASAYLNRTMAAGSAVTVYTFSAWVKRGELGTIKPIVQGYLNNNNYGHIIFKADNTIEWREFSVAVNYGQVNTNAVFRDPSAWYHIVVVRNGTSLLIYVNGVSQTLTVSTGVNAAGGYLFGASTEQRIGRDQVNSAFFDGYLTECYLIDGQALTPSSFGETNAVTGVWQPKKYTGTYGNNGFYLNFSDNSAATAAAIGKDYSGNGNNWTPNNISVTAGVTYDSMLDVPTQWADGGNGRGNYCVINSIASAVADTYSQANLKWTKVSNTTNTSAVGSIAISSGKWYWEGTVAAAGGSNLTIGIGNINTNFVSLDSNLGMTGSTTSYSYNGGSGPYKQNNNTQTSYGATFTTNDVIGVAFDADAGTLTFYKNNTSQGTAFTGITGTFTPACGGRFTNDSWYMNFGQRPFAYTPPTGFKALNTLNLPTPTILKGNQYFDASLWTGNQAARTITNSGEFQPDLIWTKSRSDAESHRLHDAVRGGNGSVLYELNSNETAAEGTDTLVSGFASNGFTIASGTNSPNITGRTYVGWQWKEGATQGFDIVTYTGNGANRTIAHNLGVEPRMMIVKGRSFVSNWNVFHKSLFDINAAYTLQLNSTTYPSGGGSPTIFNSTAPTSSVFSIGTSSDINTNGATFVAYLFSEVAGYSKFGSYTGNGSADGPFVFCGFRPRFILFKRTDSTGDWHIYDTARDDYNVLSKEITASTSGAETTAGGVRFDYLSNGFKARTTGAALNASGGTYIFAAFAENPFKNALAR